MSEPGEGELKLDRRSDHRVCGAYAALWGCWWYKVPRNVQEKDGSLMEREQEPGGRRWWWEEREVAREE